MEGVAYRAGILSLIKLKNPKTGAENQEDSKSNAEGTRQLGKQQLPWRLLFPMQGIAGDKQLAWNSLPPEKAAERKPQYSNQCQSGQTRSNVEKLMETDPACTNTHTSGKTHTHAQVRRDL